MKDMRDRGVTPYVAQRVHSAIDGRTTRHSGYGASQRVRKRVEAIFGWIKSGGWVPSDSVSGSKAIAFY